MSNLVLPCGNVICGVVYPFYISPTDIQELRDLCIPWTDNGYVLREKTPLDCHLHGHGRALDGGWFKFAPSGKLQIADIGYIPVALEVVDYAKALSYVMTDTITPCALVTEYQDILTVYNENFLHYWFKGKPKNNKLLASEVNDFDC